MPSAKAPRRANAKTGPVGKIPVPDWMPPDEREVWEIFYPGVPADDREARYMLQRLATRPEMKDAWAELRSLKATPGSLVTLTLSIWMSASYPAASLADGDQALSHAREISHAATLMYALSVLGVSQIVSLTQIQSGKPTRICRLRPVTFLAASKPCGSSVEPPFEPLWRFDCR